MNCQKLLDKMQNSDQGGYVLIEALVGIAVFGISVAALALMLSGAAKTTDRSRVTTEQTSIAADVIESLIALPYNHTLLAPGSNTYATLQRYHDKNLYTVTYNVAEDTYLKNTKMVSVTVTHNQHGVNKATTIDYIIPRNF